MGITAAARTVAAVVLASAQTTLTALGQPETHKPTLPVQEPPGPNRTCLLCIYSFICFLAVFFCLLSLTILSTLTLSYPLQTHLTIPNFPFPLFFSSSVSLPLHCYHQQHFQHPEKRTPALSNLSCTLQDLRAMLMLQALYHIFPLSCGHFSLHAITAYSKALTLFSSYRHSRHIQSRSTPQYTSDPS